MSASARKLAANRANAQRSTGARTEAGREKVAQNATKHGLSGSTFQVLSCEKQADYDAMFERFMQAEKPVDDVERELVIKMARHTWLSERAVRCQEACFLVQPQTSEDQKDRANGIALRNVDLEIYLRYQAAHDRAYQRASTELIRRRKERQLAERGFVSQKRAEAVEQRRDAREKRQVEKHSFHVATAKTKLEREQTKTFMTNAAAARQMDAYLPPQQGKIAA
jgi:hypothetical protein